MNHGLTANTLTKDLRALLLEHVDGAACVEAPFPHDIPRKVVASKLIDLRLIEFAMASRTATRITDDGRRVLACVLARVAEVLVRAGYTGIESPHTERAATASWTGLIAWDLEERRVTTPRGSAVLQGWRQAQVFDLLWRKRGGRGLTLRRMVDLLCADDPDGGVLEDTMKSTVLLLRRRLAPVGICVVGAKPGTRDGYVLDVEAPRLVPLDSPMSASHASSPAHVDP